MEKKKIDFGIGFADSEIISYHSEEENVVILLKSWNEKLVNIAFINCIFFLCYNNWYISDFCEVSQSANLKQALKKIYEIPPKECSYKIFNFFDIDDVLAIEIIAESVSLSILHG